MYECLQQKGSLEQNVSRGFEEIRKMSLLPYGALADFTAAALFLTIADDSKLDAVKPLDGQLIQA